MRAPVTQLLDEWARKTSPVAVTLVLAILAVMRVPLPGFSIVAPMLPVMAVFYWSLARPELLPPIAVFGVGIVIDSLNGTPLGFNALMLLLVCGFVRWQRAYLVQRGFMMHWVAFGVVVTAFEIMRWTIMSGLSVKLIAVGPPAVRVLLAIAIYPCISWFLLRVQQAFLKPVQEH